METKELLNLISYIVENAETYFNKDYHTAEERKLSVDMLNELRFYDLASLDESKFENILEYVVDTLINEDTRFIALNITDEDYIYDINLVDALGMNTDSIHFEELSELYSLYFEIASQVQATVMTAKRLAESSCFNCEGDATHSMYELSGFESFGYRCCLCYFNLFEDACGHCSICGDNVLEEMLCFNCKSSRECVDCCDCVY